jgi:hypothetical protein
LRKVLDNSELEKVHFKIFLPLLWQELDGGDGITLQKIPFCDEIRRRHLRCLISSPPFLQALFRRHLGVFNFVSPGKFIISVVGLDPDPQGSQTFFLYQDPEHKVLDPGLELEYSGPELKISDQDPELKVSNPDPYHKVSSPDPNLKVSSPDPDLKVSSPDPDLDFGLQSRT